MNQELMKEFKADLKEFREMTEKFYAKEVSVKDYKGFSGGFGSYAQKGGEASMLRLRLRSEHAPPAYARRQSDEGKVKVPRRFY